MADHEPEMVVVAKTTRTGHGQSVAFSLLSASMQKAVREEYPGLGVRWGVYLTVGLLIVGSGLTLPASPTDLTWPEIIGLIGAITAGMIFPVSNGPVGLWRSRSTLVSPVLIVLCLTSSPQATVLIWLVGALASGVVIRRRRFTPGRMAVGASMVTSGALVAAWTVSALDGTPLACRAMAGSLAYSIGAMVVAAPVYAAAAREPLVMELRKWNYPARVPLEATGACIAVSTVLLRPEHPWAIALSVLPYAMTIASGLQRIRLRHSKMRDAAMLRLSHQLGAAAAPSDVDALVIEAACAVLDAPGARISDRPPAEHEIGEPWDSGWLIAEDRRGLPTFNPHYDHEDQERLRGVVLAGRAAVEHLDILRRLEAMSLEDELTHLPNRRGAERALRKMMGRAQRHDLAVAVVLLDIDHFKRFNDTHGHLVGDQVLAATAQRLSGAVRADAAVARWGGEEFLAIVPCSGPDATAIAERVRAAGSQPLLLGEADPLQVTMSAGVTVWDPALPLGPQETIDIADRALYDAKESGRDRTCARTDGGKADTSSLHLLDSHPE